LSHFAIRSRHQCAAAGGSARDPLAVAFDGANIWVTNYGSNTVSKLYRVAPSGGGRGPVAGIS